MIKIPSPAWVTTHKTRSLELLHDLLAVLQVRISLLLFNSLYCSYSLWKEESCGSSKFQGLSEICKLFIFWVLISLLLKLPEC